MADNINVSLPYNMEAEQSVLGSVLLKPECISDVLVYINHEAFYIPMHQEIFFSMQQMFTQNNAAIDPVTIADSLAKSGTLNLGEAKKYLFELSQIVPSAANVEKYAQIVKEQYYLRKLITVSQDIIDRASSGSADASQLLDNAEQQIYDIRQGKIKNGPEPLYKVIESVYERFKELTGENKEQYKGIPRASVFLISTSQVLTGRTSFLSAHVLQWVKRALHSTLRLMWQSAQRRNAFSSRSR